MLRLLRLIILMGVFVGGYYLGRMPNSPDIIAYAKDACHAAGDASSDISAKAKAEGTSIPQATISYIKEYAGKKSVNQAQQELPGIVSDAAGQTIAGNPEQYR
jgi:uncharacterized protein (UPF0333 family)